MEVHERGKAGRSALATRRAINENKSENRALRLHSVRLLVIYLFTGSLPINRHDSNSTYVLFLQYPLEDCDLLTEFR